MANGYVLVFRIAIVIVVLVVAAIILGGSVNQSPYSACHSGVCGPSASSTTSGAHYP